MSNPPVDLSVRIAGTTWHSPITTASGTMSGWDQYAQIVSLDAFGAITVKSITLQPRAGNPAPRLAETHAGLINSIGIPNPGLAGFLAEELPKVKKVGVPLIVSIAGHSVAEYVTLAERLTDVDGIAALEINMSCPNVGKETMEFGQSPNGAAALMRELRRATPLPLIPKLTPNVADPAEIARAVVAEGADAVALINTVLGMSLDILTGLPKTGRLMGGLSGPAVKPIALRMVWQVSEAVAVPVIGMGGIMTADDAIEFLMAGASAVALGTVNFINPRAVLEVRDGIAAYLAEHGISSVRDLVGLAKRRWAEYGGGERLHV